MKFAKRMDRFGEGVFSSLAEIRKQKEEKMRLLSIVCQHLLVILHLVKAKSQQKLVFLHQMKRK